MAESSTSSSSVKRFLLVYGSQTGQAQAIAEEICQQAVTRGYSPDMHCFSKSEKEFVISEEPLVVIIVSTTGEGEPPDTVSRFWRKLKRKNVPMDLLNGVHYALLGLGDTNYTNFCNMGKLLNKRLQELSAHCIYETGYADDGVGLELVVDPWIEGLWGALQKYFSDDTTVHDFVPLSDKTVQDPIPPNDNTVQDSIPPDDTTVQDPVLPNDTTVQDPIPSNGTTVQDPVLLKDATIETLVHSVTEQLNLDASCAEPGMLLRGSNDDSWIYQPVVSPSPPAYLKVDLHKGDDRKNSFSFTESVQGSTMTKSIVSMGTISNRRVLTAMDAEKVVLELEISWKGSDLQYQPGDALCFICPNDLIEVEYVIERLKLQSVRDYFITLSIHQDTGKKNPVIPKHIPKSCTVYQYLTHCADLRAIPKKALLTVLSEYCTSDFERKRLKWLASRQGSGDYMKLVLEPHIDLLDLLHTFSTCSPPLERLIELLPRLQARHYSVVSSPLLCGENKTKIVFNIAEIPSHSWLDRKRQGLCTGWLNILSLGGNRATPPVIPIYSRLKNPFHLPADPMIPIIMIGPGTGVAPLIGFLEHRKALKTVKGIDVGLSWLFFGCRHPDQDFLYKVEIEKFIATRILTSFDVSFSRLSEDLYSSSSLGPEGSGHYRYVQDLMRKHWKSLGEWILEKEAVVYVCGDAQKMLASIKEVMNEILHQYATDKGSYSDTKNILKDLIDSGKYIVDLWI